MGNPCKYWHCADRIGLCEEDDSYIDCTIKDECNLHEIPGNGGKNCMDCLLSADACPMSWDSVTPDSKMRQDNRKDILAKIKAGMPRDQIQKEQDDRWRAVLEHSRTTRRAELLKEEK